MIYPWQQSQWQTLVQQQSQQHLHHAYLLTGMHGLGQFDFARHVGHWLLCKQPNEQGACGHCSSCQLLSSQNHPDFFVLQPEAGKKSISVAALREQTEQVLQTANQGGYQIVIIQPAESMTLAAANALLKTLEEPAGDVLFLLVCYELGRLPITVRSRCQNLNFTADASATAWLQQQLSGLDAEQALKLASGAPLTAVQQAESDYHEQRSAVWQQIQDVIARRHTWQAASKALAKTDKLLIIEIMQSIATDLLKHYLQSSEQHIANRDIYNQLSNFKINAKQLMMLSKQLQQLRQLLQRGAGVNADLQMLNLWRLWSNAVAH